MPPSGWRRTRVRGRQVDRFVDTIDALRRRALQYSIERDCRLPYLLQTVEMLFHFVTLVTPRGLTATRNVCRSQHLGLQRFTSLRNRRQDYMFGHPGTSASWMITTT